MHYTTHMNIVGPMLPYTHRNVSHRNAEVSRSDVVLLSNYTLCAHKGQAKNYEAGSIIKDRFCTQKDRETLNHESISL